MNGRSALIVVARGVDDMVRITPLVAEPRADSDRREQQMERDFEDKAKKHVLGNGAVLDEYRVKATLQATVVQSPNTRIAFVREEVDISEHDWKKIDTIPAWAGAREGDRQFGAHIRRLEVGAGTAGLGR